jgi:hypothetical protein
MANFHEDLDRSFVQKKSSERQFGVVMGIVLALIGAKFHRHPTAFCVLLVLAGLFLLTALVMPRALAPLNIAWAFLGKCIGKVTNPVLITLTYVICFVPVGLFFRLTGKDPLHLKRGNQKSYWIEKPEAIPASESMRRQF